MNRNSILTIVIAVALIGMSVYTINTYNKNPSNSAFGKIVVDVFSVLFILLGAGAIYTTLKK